MSQAAALRAAELLGEPLARWEPIDGGWGGASRVWLAGGRCVVAKVVTDPGAFQRNVSGAELLQEIGFGEHVARLLATDGGERLLVMEALEGPSLADLLLGDDAQGHSLRSSPTRRCWASWQPPATGWGAAPSHPGSCRPNRWRACLRCWRGLGFA